VIDVERSKILLWALVLVAAGIIVWRVGFHTSESPLIPGEPKAAAQPSRLASGKPIDANSVNEPEPNQPAEPNETAVADAPAEPNAVAKDEESAGAADANEPGPPGREDRGRRPAPPQEAKSDEPEERDDPNNPMEAVNLKNVEMKSIIDKIATWTGKTVIPDDEAMKQKITIYAPKQLPRKKALEKIYSALRMKGFVAEEVDDTIFLKPLKEARLGRLPTVSADEPLALLENKDQVVQKFFKLNNYPPAKMTEVIQPLVGDYGHVGADEATGSLLVIETVANLMQIESVIKQFDVPEAEQVVEEFFTIEHGDPSEIVQLLRMLMGESPRGGRSSYRGRVSSYRRPSPSRGGPAGRGGPSGEASSVVISTGDIPIVLIPVPERKWIIARGAADDIQQIRGWIDKLDMAEPVQSEYETIPIMYANPSEVAERIEDALEDLSGTDFRPSVLVREVEQSRQIMIFGRPDLRDMVKKLIAEIDVPAGTFEEKTFDLEHADAEQIKENIDNLYGDDQDSSNRYNYYYWRYGRGQESPSDKVKVIAFPTMGQVTVIASPENMRKIEQQIEEWDVPLDVDAVKPRIIELQNSDPVQMTELLTKLFTEESDNSSSLWRILWWGDDVTQRKKIVGPLYGQLTFEDLPGTKKIIVISKIPQAYDVIEQLIYELDRQEMAEIPTVVQLKYADPEDLSERLNAMFNEPGTTAPIRRTTRGLSAYSMDDSDNSQNQGGNRNDGGGGANNPGEYTPWWSRGGGRRPDEEPISNVIGRVRFIPDPRSKSILVLAPPEFQANIRETIDMLDVPGKQVMIKAIIMTVDHEDVTSLGLQLASDPTSFGALEENSVTALNDLSTWAERGSFSFGAGMNVTLLVDFLLKKTNAQVLNEQTVWTKDNEEASFFRGDKVAFQTDFSVSDTGGRATSSFEFERVGMTLRARPSITPEKNVDMVINVILSQLTNDLVNTQPVRTEMETTTNMIVADGETIMLGGMLFQQNTAVQRKLPLLGDVPVAGELFRHNDNIVANEELIVFITPYVVDDGEAMSEEARMRMEETRRKLDNVKRRMEEDTERLKDDLEDIRGQVDEPAPSKPRRRSPSRPQQPATTVASGKRPMPFDHVWR
jgi:type II secretory pathway component GspD/PulD (secretin)